MASKFEIRIGEPGVRARDCTVSKTTTWECPGGTILHDPLVKTLSEEEVLDITDWVHANNLGRRISWATWRLNSDSAITAFVLRWGK